MHQNCSYFLLFCSPTACSCHYLFHGQTCDSVLIPLLLPAVISTQIYGSPASTSFWPMFYPHCNWSSMCRHNVYGLSSWQWVPHPALKDNLSTSTSLTWAVGVLCHCCRNRILRLYRQITLWNASCPPWYCQVVLPLHTLGCRDTAFLKG